MKTLQKPFLPPNEPLPSHFRNPGGNKQVDGERTNREELLTGLREVFRDECARARLGLGPGVNIFCF